ncbi:MAG: hypothetical protein OHK0039_28740 [Bacteroidia bacterium]
MLCFAAVLPAQPALHMILIADTDDPAIGASKDYWNMQGIAYTVAQTTGLRLQRYYFEQHKTGAYELIQVLDNLQCGPEDVVWFYYSGHGVAAEAKAGRAATFRLGSYNFAIDRIHHKLLSKRPGLLITMYDCCAYTTSNPMALRRLRMFEGKPTNYSKLFLETRGDLLVQSNTGDLSYGDMEIGGIFTYAFRQSLNFITAGNSEACTWESLLERTRIDTEHIAQQNEVRQVPAYQSNLRSRTLRLHEKR